MYRKNCNYLYFLVYHNENGILFKISVNFVGVGRWSAAKATPKTICPTHFWVCIPSKLPFNTFLSARQRISANLDPAVDILIRASYNRYKSQVTRTWRGEDFESRQHISQEYRPIDKRRPGRESEPGLPVQTSKMRKSRKLQGLQKQAP